MYGLSHEYVGYTDRYFIRDTVYTEQIYEWYNPFFTCTANQSVTSTKIPLIYFWRDLSGEYY